MKRKPISPATRQLVLLEAGYQCANPVCRHILTLELHHIVWVKDDGNNDPSNLLALCPNCHSLHTYGHIPGDAIAVWKGMLVSLNSPHRANVDLLLMLYREQERVGQAEDPEQVPPSFRFTGDSLPALSGLIVSGLVEISRRFSGSSYWGGGMPSFEVNLTQGGRMLVDAWISGNPDRLTGALRKQNRRAEEMYGPEGTD